MEILPEPKGVDDKLLELLKELVGEDGLTFLDLDNAITAVKQGQPFWQAPFAIGLRALPFLYHWEADSQDTAIPDLARLVLGLSSQIHSRGKDMTVSDFVGSALEALEARYASLSAEIPGCVLTDEQVHTLFHTRFALGVLLLLKGDEARARMILYQMAETKTTRRGPTWSLEGLGQVDVGETKVLAAIILQDFYARRQDYNLALYLLTEAVASNSPEFFSGSLLAVIPGLLESFAEKCERVNRFEEWVGLFDRAAGIIEVCGKADVSGNLPSDCKIASPQFLAWKFGHLVARAICCSLYQGNGKQVLPSDSQDPQTVVDSILCEGGYGDDWQNGTVVASLLCEYDKYRNWQILRQQYVSMWEALPRYQWLSLPEAGTQTDLYWAMRIGFADKMLEIAEQGFSVSAQSESSRTIHDIEMTKDIASTVALRQLKVQQDLDKISELLQKLIERQEPSKGEIAQQLQQRLSPVWEKLPAKVVDTMTRAESYYKTGVETDNAKVWFNRAVEASLNYCLVEPLVKFMQKRNYERIAVCFLPPRGVEHKTSHELRNKMSLRNWSDVFGTLSVPVNKDLASLGTQELRGIMKELFGELPLPALRELSRSLRDFSLRRDAGHDHVLRHEEEIQELEQMRELVLGIKRPSLITQIFQLFG